MSEKSKKRKKQYIDLVVGIMSLDAPFDDKLRVVVLNDLDLVSEKLMRLFAVWCARQVQHYIEDVEFTRALDVVEAYAHGKATQEAFDRVSAAVCAKGWDNKPYSTKCAARAVANATRQEAWYAAITAANSARDAAYYGVYDTEVEFSDWDSADGAKRAEEYAQKKHLLDMLDE